MDEKAQGAFEYILMLAGVLLVVIVVILVLRSQLGSTGTTVNASIGKINRTTSCNMVINSTHSCCWEPGMGCIA